MATAPPTELNQLPEMTQRFEPTLATIWRTVVGEELTDDLLSWPPDLFALCEILLSRSEAFRFALTPPPRTTQPYTDWSRRIEKAAARWCADIEHAQGQGPQLVTDLWQILRARADTPIEHLARGEDTELLEALLTLHAVADEACAGLGVALDSDDADAPVYRARGRELLIRTGSMSRLHPAMVRVLPKVRTPPSGRAAFSRYACVQTAGVAARWHKVPARHRGTDLRSEFARILLLPWPLRIKATDFRPADRPVIRPDDEPFAFFEFAPGEGLDFDLLDRVLAAAREEAGGVDVVYLPEAAVDESEIAELETLLHSHGVIFLQTGVREPSPDPERFPSNAIHMGVNPTLHKGGPLPADGATPWWHIRQRKHHRWSLDQKQIEQYHLGGALHPHVRWWEAMDVPRKTLEFVEVAELTLACLVCEDLAQNDDVAEMIRAVGPTIVFPALLDGPQLTSRWAARYASGLADDPGSAVLTLTSYGMVQRSQPHGSKASSVIGLWKDSTTGVREIELEPGAQAVLLTVCMDRATRRSADGRSPANNGTQCFEAATHQVHASHIATSSARPRPAPPPGERVLEVDELSVLTGWAEAVAETIVHAPDRAVQVVGQGCQGSAWRTAFTLPPLSDRLAQAIDSLAALTSSAQDATQGGRGSADHFLSAIDQAQPSGRPLDRLVRRVLVSMIEERRTRRALD